MPRLPRALVLDSEDEDDLIPLKPHSPVATLLHGGEDAPLDTLMDVDPPTTSTASTAEQLRLAHKALMEPTQDVVDVSIPVDVASPPDSRKRRQLIHDEPEPLRSSGKLKRIKNATNEPSSDPIELTVPGPTFPDPASTPVVGTYDTIPGQTFPSVSTSEHDVEKKTPKTRTRKSSQQHASSAEHNSNLTPWSASAIDSSDHLNSDELAIGFPEEKYKPRASRSRSYQIELAPVDYSKRPERAAKKVARAATDTKDASSTESIFPSRPILEAPEIERLSPSPPGLESTSTQLGDTIAETPADVIHEEPLPPGKTQKNAKKPTKAKQPGKRGRPKKQIAVDEEDDMNPDDEIAVATTTIPEPAPKAEVQVLISTSKPRPNSDDAAAQAGDPELINSILAGLGHKNSTEATPQPEPAPEKPAKRGRKAKATKTKTSAVPIDEPAVVEEVAVVPEPEVTDNAPEVTENAPEVTDTSPEPVPEECAPKASAELLEVKTPQPTKKGALKTSSSKPSWQQTPHRVGLSKSQRIPSLLKVFKK